MEMMTRQFGHFPSDLFLYLRWLNILEFHDDESADNPTKLFLYKLHHLKELEVKNCSFQEIFPYEGEGPPVLLPRLTTLTLTTLPEVKYICKEDSPLIPILEKLEDLFVSGCPRLANLTPRSTSFKFLMSLIVYDCGGLITLTSSSAAASLEQLDCLIINKCQMIEEIVASDGDHDSQEDEIIFSKLKFLTLVDLPRLTNFCTTNYTFKFPELTAATVVQCPNMRTFSPGITITPQLKTVYMDNSSTGERWNGDLNTTIQQYFSEMETERLATTDPSTSSSNHFEPEAQIHEKPTESAGKEAEEIHEEFTEPREDGQVFEDGIDELGKKAAISKNVIKPEYEIDVSENAIEPREGVEIVEKDNEPKKGIVICEEVIEGGNEIDICGKATELSHSDPSSFSPANEPEEQTNAGSLAPRDVVSSLLLSPESNHPETSPSLVTEAGTSRAASTSQQWDCQGFHVTRHFITMFSKVLQILQIQPRNTISAEEVQFMEDAYHDLSNMNFPMEWLCPYVEKARKCISVVERTKVISELELKIAETMSELQALEETKKGLEEENGIIASTMDMDKPLYDD